MKAVSKDGAFDLSFRRTVGIKDFDKAVNRNQRDSMRVIGNTHYSTNLSFRQSRVSATSPAGRALLTDVTILHVRIE